MSPVISALFLFTQLILSSLSSRFWNVCFGPKPFAIPAGLVQFSFFFFAGPSFSLVVLNEVCPKKSPYFFLLQKTTVIRSPPPPPPPSVIVRSLFFSLSPSEQLAPNRHGFFFWNCLVEKKWTLPTHSSSLEGLVVNAFFSCNFHLFLSPPFLLGLGWDRFSHILSFASPIVKTHT